MSRQYPVRKHNNKQKGQKRRPEVNNAEVMRARESAWMGLTGAKQTIRQLGLRTFTTAMSQNEAALQQAAGFTHLEFSFSIGAMNGSADYLALFDSYRILKVEAIIRPTITVGTSSTTVNFVAPTVYTIVDYDDVNPLTSSTLYREYANCTLTQYETVVRKFTPAVNQAAYSVGGALTSSTNVFAPWCDAASVNTEHHGLRIGMDGGTAVIPQTLNVNITFLVEWRCTR